jgi:hypothetical protein
MLTDAARQRAREIAEAMPPLTERQCEVIRRCLAPPVPTAPARRKAHIQRLALRSVQAAVTRRAAAQGGGGG